MAMDTSSALKIFVVHDECAVKHSLLYILTPASKVEVIQCIHNLKSAASSRSLADLQLCPFRAVPTWTSHCSPSRVWQLLRVSANSSTRCLLERRADSDAAIDTPVIHHELTAKPKSCLAPGSPPRAAETAQPWRAGTLWRL